MTHDSPPELHDRGFIPRIFPLLVFDGSSMQDIANL